VSDYAFVQIEKNNPQIDFREIERKYPPEISRKAAIHELDRQIRGF